MPESTVLPVRNEPVQIVRAVGDPPAVVAQVGIGLRGLQGDPGDSHVPDPSGEVDDRWLTTLAGALVYTDAPEGSSGPPAAHAASHGDGGSDEVTLAQSQVTGLATALAALLLEADLPAAVAALDPTDFPAALARDAEVTSAIATAVSGLLATVDLAAAVLGLALTDFPAGLARDAEVTAAISAAVAGVVNSAPGALDTLDELAAALGDDANFAATVTNALALKAPLASPTFTGTPAGPTAAGGTNTTQLATTAFVQAAAALLVSKSLYDANSILAATTDDTPAALTVGASTFVGRKASGNIAAMTPAEARVVIEHAVAFYGKRTGALTAVAGTTRLYNDTGRDLVITAVRATVETSPTGAALLVDVNKSGTTIFTSQSNRPSIAISGTTAKAAGIDVTAWPDGDYLTFDVDQIGSTIAGSDLTVQVTAR